MRLSEEAEIVDLISSSKPGKNTKFLNASHSLWKRFGNYDRYPPLVYGDAGEIKSVIFATFSVRSRYVNLYEICTVQGQEGKGYASNAWDGFLDHSQQHDMGRLKISCTPSSIGWHIKNGLIFWSVDPSGSLRSDQPIFSTREKQIEFRENAIKKPEIALPEGKVMARLKAESLEDHNFGIKKASQVMGAIKRVGKSWLRKALFKQM
tara:strand:- start:1746 stop:2366 length:621 start_codon:yes stop_codon:yes gene_type:complete